MNYIEAPNDNYLSFTSENALYPKIFLGGGITNCKDWQSKLVAELKNENCHIFNPRRENFDINDPTQSEIQIKWEFKYLRNADIVVFYFSEETICPITLFELGSRLEATIDTGQSVYVYCEPNYARKFDVEFQTKLMTDLYKNVNADYFEVAYCSSYDDWVNRIKKRINVLNYKDIFSK